MELLFYSLAGIIVIVVIAVSRKSIVAGMEARSDINRENKPGDTEEGIEDITNENIEKTREQVKIINQIDDLILIVDKFKNIKFFNNSAKKEFGEKSNKFHNALLYEKKYANSGNINIFTSEKIALEYKKNYLVKTWYR